MANTTFDILEAFGTKLKEDSQEAIDTFIKANANKHGGDFGGNSDLANSAKFYFTSDGDNLKFLFKMNNYWIVFNDGAKWTGAKKQPPSDKLESWVRKRGIKLELSKRKLTKIKNTKDKGIKKQLKAQSYEKKVKQMAFVIARSIGKKGIEANHFFDKIINDGRIEQLSNDLAKSLQREVVLELKTFRK